jgi:hypothetical protein
MLGSPFYAEDERCRNILRNNFVLVGCAHESVSIDHERADPIIHSSAEGGTYHGSLCIAVGALRAAAA